MGFFREKKGGKFTKIFPAHAEGGEEAMVGTVASIKYSISICK